MYRLFCVFLIMMFFSACQKQEITTNCETISDCEILPENKKGETCIYSEVYRYEGKIYTIYNCCVCDLIYIAIDCDGNWLCEEGENCMDDFDKKAKYLYSVVKE